MMNAKSLVPQLIHGEFSAPAGSTLPALKNPATLEVLAQCHESSKDEVASAVSAAKGAFPAWSDTPVAERMRLMMRYQTALKSRQREIAELICEELGKTLEDAMGDVWRGIEVVEHACSVGNLMMGEHLDNVARGIDTHSLRVPLGVCAGITPFNFPAMIPLWMFPLANACGNTFVLKPSPRTPMTAVRLAEIFLECDAPPGILQVVHGNESTAQALIEHPDVRALSFVGSTHVGREIYRKGTAQLKRVQCMTGAKNHSVVLPDANRQQTVNGIAGAAFGAAGQRCMASSVCVLVGESQTWLGDIRAAAAELQPGHWRDEGAAYGPLVSDAAKARVCELIASAEREGARCVLDGREFRHSQYPDGHWLGPTILSEVKAEMRVYREEVFGPVLCVMHAPTLEAAIELINQDFRANGTAVFTQSGARARQFQQAVNVGQVGINVPIPVPVPFFSFTGWRGSFHGDLHAYGKDAVRFYTETQTVISRWFADEKSHENTGPNTSIHMR